MLLSRLEYRACRRILRRYGTSYRWATLTFPAREREATAALYAFFRLPDEMVDNPREDAAPMLAQYRRDWHQAFKGIGETANFVLSAAVKVFRRYDIPRYLAEEFLDAMEQDLTTRRYASYEDLAGYMKGSAGSVGSMMTYVIGFQDDETFEYAERLGFAMQLTNFVRDVREDLDRGRIYFPLEDLDRFNVSEQSFISKDLSPAMRQLIHFETDRARDLYRQAEPGIAMLHQRGRNAVRLASRLYEGILDKVEASGFDVFAGRVRTNNLDKLRLAQRAWSA